jgi:hypothetical protein
MITSSIHHVEGSFFNWDSQQVQANLVNWHWDQQQINQNESVLSKSLQTETEDENDFSYLMQCIQSVLMTGYDPLSYSPFKYSLYNVENLNTKSLMTYQDIARTIFNKPFSYFSQDPLEF